MLIIKVGGGTSINETAIAKDIKSLSEKVVFVHGASNTRDRLARKLGNPTKKITSPGGQVSVLTDSKALEILTMSYSLINKQWVSVFQKEGLNAVGLSGADGKIWEGERKKYLVSKEGKREKLVKNTWTGRVKRINTNLIKLLLKSNYLPIITQPAITPQAELINTDNDLNLAVMAKELKADKLVVLFEAPGMLKNPQDDKSIIKRISKNDLPEMLKLAKGTMKKKVLGAQEALNMGVRVIYWGDSRIENPVKSALKGKGTVIT